MGWFIALIVVIIVAAIVIAFLNKFYQKATPEVALLRTGFGGRRIVIDGGCLTLPFLNKVTEINMKTLRLEVDRAGNDSLITEDRLRVDLKVEYYLRVRATDEGIAVAAQTLGGKTFRPGELYEMIGGKLVDALQAVVAERTLDALHERRAEFVGALESAVREDLSVNGLDLETVSLIRLDQTSFDALNENNAFNAVGMRRLAEVIAQNKKQRAQIEAEADVAVRQSHLDANKRKLVIEQEQEEAQIEQQLAIEKSKAAQVAEIAEKRSEAEMRSEEARIAKEREVRSAEISRDRELRALELQSALNVDIADRDNQIAIATKASEVSAAEAKAELARAEAVAAAERVQTEKERAIAERARDVALIRAKEAAEVENTRLETDTSTIREQARAEADALLARASAKRDDLVAEADGRAAMVSAENALSEPVIRMKTEMHKIDALPGIVEQMVKPAEKIEGIRINHISGLGGVGGTGGDGEKPMVNQAIDGLMSMALQLPALQRLGKEIGINLENGITGVTEAAKSAESGEDED